MQEIERLLKKISDLAYDEDVGEPLDDAIGYANKALEILRAQSDVRASTIDDVPSCGQENDYRRASPAHVSHQGEPVAECGCTDECQHKPDCVFERKEGALVSDQGDIIERLRNPMWAHSSAPFESPQIEQEENVAAMNEAADEIASLRAQLAIAGEHIAEMTDQLASARKARRDQIIECLRRFDVFSTMDQVADALMALTDDTGNSK